MAMVPRLLVLICGCLLVVLGAMPVVHGEDVVIGVNVVNPQRLSLTDRAAAWGPP